VRRLLVTANVVPSSPILVTLMMEVLSSSETSVFTILLNFMRRLGVIRSAEGNKTDKERATSDTDVSEKRHVLLFHATASQIVWNHQPISMTVPAAAILQSATFCDTPWAVQTSFEPWLRRKLLYRPALTILTAALWRMVSSGMLPRVALVRTDVGS
jgi:hypothetical protein